MKLNDYRQQLERDPEYLRAMEERRLQFAIGNAVLRARLGRGWSQADLAEAVGTKQANISRLEAGQANPTLQLLGRVFQCLGLEVKIEPVDASRSEGASTGFDPGIRVDPQSQRAAL